MGDTFFCNKHVSISLTCDSAVSPPTGHLSPPCAGRWDPHRPSALGDNRLAPASDPGCSYPGVIPSPTVEARDRVSKAPVPQAPSTLCRGQRVSVAVFAPPAFSATFPKTVARGCPRGFFLKRGTRVPTRVSQCECISTCVTLVTLWWDLPLERHRWGVVGADQAQRPGAETGLSNPQLPLPARGSAVTLLGKGSRLEPPFRWGVSLARRVLCRDLRRAWRSAVPTHEPPSR